MQHSYILLVPILLVLTMPDPISLPASDKIIIDYNENTHQSVGYSSVSMRKIRTKVYENHTLRIRSLAQKLRPLDSLDEGSAGGEVEDKSSFSIKSLLN